LMYAQCNLKIFRKKGSIRGSLDMIGYSAEIMPMGEKSYDQNNRQKDEQYDL